MRVLDHDGSDCGASGDSAWRDCPRCRAARVALRLRDLCRWHTYDPESRVSSPTGRFRELSSLLSAALEVLQEDDGCD